MTEKLKVYSGPMFSGKTTSLKNEIELAVINHEYVLSFKPHIDTRSHQKCFTYTHDNVCVSCLSVENAGEILKIVEKVENDNTPPNKTVKVVIIDEAQFFGDEILQVIKQLLAKDIKIIVGGLDHDFRDEPFGHMPEIIEMADERVKLTAKCTFVDENGVPCNLTATKTQRIIGGKPANYNDQVVLIGSEECYEARCPEHHIVPGKPVSVIIFPS